jgi:hypothetical protein
VNWDDALEAAEQMFGPVRLRRDGRWAFDAVEIPGLRMIRAANSEGWPVREQAERARAARVDALAELFTVDRVRRESRGIR